MLSKLMICLDYCLYYFSKFSKYFLTSLNISPHHLIRTTDSFFYSQTETIFFIIMKIYHKFLGMHLSKRLFWERYIIIVATNCYNQCRLTLTRWLNQVLDFSFKTSFDSEIQCSNLSEHRDLIMSASSTSTVRSPRSIFNAPCSD